MSKFFLMFKEGAQPVMNSLPFTEMHTSYILFLSVSIYATLSTNPIAFRN